MEEQETKQCPFCGEIMNANAKKCKHCGEWIDKSTHTNNFFTNIVDFLTSKNCTKTRNTFGTAIILVSLIFTLISYILIWSDDSAIRQCVYALFLIFNILSIIGALLLIDKEK